MTVRVAVLMDGGFVHKRLYKVCPKLRKFDGNAAADQIYTLALSHLNQSNKKHKVETSLYRLFYYDCPPYQKKHHFPVTNRAIDFSKTDEAKFRYQLHKQLIAKRKVALRLGHLGDHEGWKLKPGRLKSLQRGDLKWENLKDEDYQIAIRQKGVDMRIAVDVASLAFKKQVDQIVLFSGDADFVPAAKLARREGIDFILDPMWQHAHPELMEHIDGLRSTTKRPT